jgi:AraC family transcriptional regulator of adaptative response / methylphosphotriester-DNA alkyltransferase methyltransferase
VKKVKDIFDANYDQLIEPKNISNQLGVSINHIVRLFKQHYGLTPTQYVTKFRVDKAAELLRQEEVKILEIAYLTGFQSVSNFYRCFKEQVGFTPREYRNDSLLKVTRKEV